MPSHPAPSSSSPIRPPQTRSASPDETRSSQRREMHRPMIVALHAQTALTTAASADPWVTTLRAMQRIAPDLSSPLTRIVARSYLAPSPHSRMTSPSPCLFMWLLPSFSLSASHGRWCLRRTLLPSHLLSSCGTQSWPCTRPARRPAAPRAAARGTAAPPVPERAPLLPPLHPVADAAAADHTPHPPLPSLSVLLPRRLTSIDHAPCLYRRLPPSQSAFFLGPP